MSVETVCKRCIFAERNGKTQTGCKLGRIDKYREQGSEIVEAYDEDSEFYVIKDRICLMLRDQKWADNQAGELQYAARLECTSPAEVITVMTNHTIEDAVATMRSLEKQTLPPWKVWVVLNQDGIRPTQLIKAFNDERFSTNWQIKQMVEKTPDGKYVGAHRCLDLTVMDVEAGYYAHAAPGFVYPPDFIETLDNALIDKLERFSVLTGPVEVIQVAMHKHVGGHRPLSVDEFDTSETPIEQVFENPQLIWLNNVVEKVWYIAAKEHREFLIKQVSEICPSIQQ